MVNQSRRKVLALATVLALTASTNGLAANLDADNILTTSSGERYMASDATSLYGLHAYDNSLVSFNTLNFQNRPYGTIAPLGERAFIQAEDSIVLINGGFMDPAQSPSNTLAHVNNSTVSIGIDEHDQLTNQDKNLYGDVIVGGRDTPLKNGPSHSEMNIALNTPNSYWEGMAFNVANTDGNTGAINLTLNNGGVWVPWMSSTLNRTDITGSALPLESHINNLVGTTNRDTTTAIYQGEAYPVYINHLEGHMNIVYDHDGPDNTTDVPSPGAVKDGLRASNYWGGPMYIASAAPGSAVHVVTNPEGIDTDDTAKVETVLNHLANKMFYTGFVNGESNLTGTVSIASHDDKPSYIAVVSANGKTLEGDIEWQANNNGQGRYAPGTLGRADTNHTNNSNTNTNGVNNSSNNHTNNGNTNTSNTNGNINNNSHNNGAHNILRGDADTLHMRGVRSAVYSNIGAWRTLTDSMYRSRALQQGEPTGIWAHIMAGRYDFTGRGVSNESEYTRFQGGFDKQFNTLIVGGQVDYLHGDDDFINHGMGKERSFAIGAYALKQLGHDAYVHVETKAGRVSNDFTVYGELFNTPMQAMDTRKGKVKSTAYSMAVRVGKQVKFGNGLYIEPQAQLSYMHLGGDTFTTGAMTVNQSAVNSTTGHIALEMGKTFGAGNVYTRFDVGHAFTGNVKTQYNNTVTETDIKGTWTNIAFGGRYGIGTNNSIYADVNRGLGGDYKQKWSVTAGFTHKF